MDVKDYASRDAPAIQRLLTSTFGRDSLSKNYPHCYEAGTVVVWHGRQVVGMGSLWRNPLHPYANRTTVVVAPSHRRKGIGSALWSALLARSTGLSLVTSLWETEMPGQQFAIRQGFHRFRQTYMTQLQVGSGVQDLPDVALLSLEPLGYRLEPLTALSAGIQRRNVAKLARDLYRIAHHDNPPANLPPDQWTTMTFAPDLIYDGSSTIHHEETLIGLALLHQGKDRQVFDLGWRGVVPVHRHHEQALMVWVTRLQMAWVAQHNGHTLTLEADSTDPASFALLDAFPFPPVPSWDTWKRS